MSYVSKKETSSALVILGAKFQIQIQNLSMYVLVFQVHHCLRQIPVANGNAFSFVDPSWQILQFFHTLHLIHFLGQQQYPLFSSRSWDIMEKNDMDSVTRIIGHTQSLVFFADFTATSSLKLLFRWHRQFYLLDYLSTFCGENSIYFDDSISFL